jgi:hypothetical protein
MPSAARTAELLLLQAGHCAVLGSPLYGALLAHAAEDARQAGPTFALLKDEPAPGPRGDALGLRLMAAAHRLALLGRAPEWAAFLPSVREGASNLDRHGAPADIAVAEGAAWLALRDLIATRADELRPLVARPCQTNEVGRSAALAFGFFAAARTGLPLRLLEVGASAGLNLRFDHFRFGGGGAAWGPSESPVNLEGLWLEAPGLPRDLRVAGRTGCDRQPVDISTEDGRLSLLSSVWADQPARFARLEGALEIARRVPASVAQADLAAWLPHQLEKKRPGYATVVYHSIVDEYLPEATRHAFHECLHTAGAQATGDAPLYWLRLEPFPDQRTYGVTVKIWPGGTERLLAYSGPHGNDARPAPGQDGPSE